MRKKMSVLIVAAVFLTLAAGCAGKVPDGYDKDRLTQRAKEVVETINTLDYNAVILELRQDLQSQITPESLSDAWDANLSALGAFKDYKNIAYTSTKSGNIVYAVVVLNCTYENGSAIYTLSFDSDYELVGLYMK
jgi:hypothetical protein